MSHIKIPLNSSMTVGWGMNVYHTDTPEQIAAAAKALSKVGLMWADVWEGTPCQNDFLTGERIFAE